MSEHATKACAWCGEIFAFRRKLGSRGAFYLLERVQRAFVVSGPVALEVFEGAEVWISHPEVCPKRPKPDDEALDDDREPKRAQGIP